jgi:dihydrodipicolinate synthase/N-acetylneuraminate lyase
MNDGSTRIMTSTNAAARMAVPALRPGRTIEGISAVLLPYGADDRPDWESFRALLARTWRAGLTPAVNMDTGYVNLLTPTERAQVLAETSDVAAGRRFVAGAFIEGAPGDPALLYRAAIDDIRRSGGTPILFQCSALAERSEAQVLDVLREVGRAGSPLLAFELGTMFAPFGRIYSADFIARLFEIDAFVGAKHSSLDRVCELERLAARDRHRPDFKIYTGNDLAIDMVFYGSDYLLGLSAFAVEAFAVRDAAWASNDVGAFAINDILQYLGQLAFRAPVPAYKHSAAQYLHLRGLISTSRPHPASATRPVTDEPILRDIADRVDAAVAAMSHLAG